MIDQTPGAAVLFCQNCWFPIESECRVLPFKIEHLYLCINSVDLN